MIAEVSRHECSKLELAVEGSSDSVRQTIDSEVLPSSAVFGTRPLKRGCGCGHGL